MVAVTALFSAQKKLTVSLHGLTLHLKLSRTTPMIGMTSSTQGLPKFFFANTPTLLTHTRQSRTASGAKRRIAPLAPLHSVFQMRSLASATTSIPTRLTRSSTMLVDLSWLLLLTSRHSMSTTTPISRPLTASDPWTRSSPVQEVSFECEHENASFNDAEDNEGNFQFPIDTGKAWYNANELDKASWHFSETANGTCNCVAIESGCPGELQDH